MGRAHGCCRISAYPVRSADPHTPRRRHLLRDRCSRARGRSRGGISARTQSLRPLPDSGRGVLSALKRVRSVRARCSHGLPIAACRRHGGAAVGRGEGSKRLSSSGDSSPRPTAAGLADTQECSCRHGGANRIALWLQAKPALPGNPSWSIAQAREPAESEVQGRRLPIF